MMGCPRAAKIVMGVVVVEFLSTSTSEAREAVSCRGLLMMGCPRAAKIAVGVVVVAFCTSTSEAREVVSCRGRLMMGCTVCRKDCDGRCRRSVSLYERAPARRFVKATVVALPLPRASGNACLAVAVLVLTNSTPKRLCSTAYLCAHADSVRRRRAACVADLAVAVRARGGFAR